jgi:3-dehydroquinate dehydratase
MELQLPFLHRIAAEHPDVEIHLWNLARIPPDFYYVREIKGPQIAVHNEQYRTRPHWMGYKNVYRHYCQEEYRDAVFVKIDDDIVFIQTDRFGDFVDAITANPGAIVSANVVNNGACSRIQPGLAEAFDMTGLPLLDWHKHNAVAAMAHEHFFVHWRDMAAEPVTVHDSDDWLSINMIGCDHDTMRALEAGIGWVEGPPTVIAGRWFGNTDRRGDEGMANTFPRRIVAGMLAAHLSFAPQAVGDLSQQATAWRGVYRRIAHTYLEEDRAALQDR